MLLTDYWEKKSFKFTVSSAYAPLVSYMARDLSLHMAVHSHSRMAGLLVKSIYLAGDGEGEEGLFLKDAAKKSQQTRAPCAEPCTRNSASQIHGKEGTNVSLI